MPSKLEFYAQMADETAGRLTGSFQNWTAFLTTASRLYKYPFNEQLMIYAQRPEATACAEYDLWNKQMRRYVRRGSRGIALIDASGDRPKLKYVFDVSDTGGRENSRRLFLWELRPEHTGPVSEALERRYGIPGEHGLANQLERVATQLAGEYWDEHRRDILDIVDGSFLEEYDEFNIGAAFRNAAAVSITYALLSRCGMAPEEYFQHEDFLSIFDWNTPDTVYALGTAISQANQEVLRQIGVTIINYEREKYAERSNDNERADLYPERGLSDPRPETVRDGGQTPGQVWEDAQEIPSGASPGAVEPPAADREAVSPPAGDRRDSEQPSGADDARIDEIGGRDGGAERGRPDAVDGPDEQLQGAGGGNDPERAGIQLTIREAPDGGQLSFFPTEAEQIALIDEAESVTHTPFAFSFAQDEIDHFLRLGSNADHHRLRIVAEFSKGKSVEENAQYLQTLFYGGNGIKIGDKSVSAWYGEDGIRLAKGNTARYSPTAQVISWQEAAERIGQLLESGQYATNVELTEAPGHERRSLALSLLYFHHDLSDKAEEQRYLPSMDQVRGGGYPDEVERLAERLQDPTFRQTLMEEYAAFWTAYREDRELLRFHYHKPQQMWDALKDLSLPRNGFSTTMTEVPETAQFITEDEINADLAGGGSYEGSRGRIFDYFQENHTAKEKADFLKNQYGTGGRSHALSRAGGSSEDHDGKGIRYQKDGCPEVRLNWNQAVKRIDELIRKGRYLSPEAIAQHETAKEAKAQEAAAHEAVKETVSGPEPAQETPGPEVASPHQETPAPAPRRELPQDDIDEALRRWNGSIESKRNVVRYMAGHARERDTAAWLAREYGTDPDKPLYVTATGTDAEVEMSWPKVQRRIAQLIQQGLFSDEPHGMDVNHNQAEQAAPRYQVVVYHHTENGFDEKLDYQTLEDAEQAAQGYVDGTLESDGFMYDGAAVYDHQERSYVRVLGDFPDSAAQAITLEETPTPERPLGPSPTVREIYEHYLPIVRERVLEDMPYRNACANSDRENAYLEGDAAIKRAVSTIEDASFINLYYGLGGFHNNLHRDILDETYPALAAAAEEIPAPEAETPASPRDPLAPAYAVGDTVYLDDTAFQITEVSDYNVQLRDPALAYPIFRAESKTQFEVMLYQDARNASITEYLAQDLENSDSDLQDVLTWDGGLLEHQDKEAIAGLFHTGESNTRIAQYLSDTYAGRADTMTMQTGEETDYFATAAGLEINIQDKYSTKHTFSWNEIARILRAMYQQERDGFFHEPVTPEEQTTQAPQTVSETVAYYPGEKNNLPYDIVIERLRVDEPEPEPPAPDFEAALDENPISIQIGGKWQTFPNVAAAETAAYEEHKASVRRNAQNFHITDDGLGTGGPKAKYQANINAIKLLKMLEAEGAQALPEQQEVLSRYVGWGGLADAFDPDKESWSAEYAELRALLTPEEYEAARASTLNAHYTSPTVIKAIYEAVGNMGFKAGNILEPSMGVGNFFGLLPEEMQQSRLYGVELDSITGRIAQQLYPKASIEVKGYEKTDFSNDFFDLAIGNVPFGQYQVNDRAYNQLGFSIHDYFFAKTLDKVRPGGVVAFVTSRYTMDKQSPEVRRHIAQRAELLGAIRLPNNAFRANAGTDVVTDILFLQKRDRPIDITPDWVHLGENEDGFAINSYFIDHPEMILGRQTSESTQYGRQDFTVAPIEGLELSDQLHDAIKYIRGTYQEADLPELGDGEDIGKTIPADPNVKNFSYTVVDGEVYYRENSVMVKPELNATATERVKGMVELRECVQQLIHLQMWDSDAVSIYKEQQRLNQLYDSFTAKYGLINSRGNSLAFADDSSYFLLCSLEVLDEDGNLKRKADMFSKRTIKQARAVTSVDTASEALAVSIAEKARVDMPYMAQLSGKTEDELAAELSGVIFRLPEPVDSQGNPRYVTADEYLSGDVRQKLARARRAAEQAPDVFGINVRALEAAQPPDLDASEIDVRLGATWIDKEYIQQFMEELLSPSFHIRRNIRVNFSEFTAEWNITGKNLPSMTDVAAYMTYGTERANAYRILEDTLNLRDIRIYDTVQDPDGKERRVLNSKETTLAQQKQQAIKDAFRDWIWKDPERRQHLVQKYNEIFNSTRPREYDGSHITFSGMNPEITLREHQKNAIAHVLYGDNVLLAHEVGAGKTFEMVAAAMESKRLGLCQNCLLAVTNHLTEQSAWEL